MRAVLQRVLKASVSVGESTIAEIGPGLCVLLGIADNDTEQDVFWVLDKIRTLRIFANAHGAMDLSLVDSQGSLLVVSQFTLLADTSRGRRPSFVHAAQPAEAERLYHVLVAKARELKIRVSTGSFGAHMRLSLVNDGPVTIVLDSKE